MTFPVKYFHSAQVGSPTISGNSPGSILALLKGALVTGIRVLSPTGITIAGGVATATFASGTFEVGEIVLIDGAAPAGLNGEAKITASSVGACSWPTDATGPVSGSITMRLAPAGWVMPFEDTGKGVFRSADVASAQFYFRVEDTAGQSARIRGFESMTDVDTGTGPFPTDTMINGGGYVWKGTAANTTAIRWKLFASSRTVFLSLAPGVASTATNFVAPLRGFGDMNSVVPAGDPWSAFVCYHGNSATASITGALDGGSNSAATGAIVLARTAAGTGGALQVNGAPYVGIANNPSGNDNTLGALGSDLAGRLRLSRRFVREAGTTSPVRAEVPGVYHIPQSGGLGLLSDGDIVDGGDALPGRTLVAVASGPGHLNTPNAVYLVDVTGPW